MECFRCNRDSREVRLLDAVHENEVVKVCERCSIIEALPVIRKPTTSQLKESERTYGVYERLRRLSGLKEKEKKEMSILEQIKRLDEHPELEKFGIDREEKSPFNLLEHFHWEIIRARRNKGLSHKQLGWAIGESEAVLKMIEKGELPEDPEKLIKKLEQFLQIKLREKTAEEIEEEERKREERLKKASKLPDVDSDEIDLEELPAPISPIIAEREEDRVEYDEMDLVSSLAFGKNIDVERENKEEFQDNLEEGEENEQISPSRILSFKPEVLKGVTIADLKRLKEEKEMEERLIALEEQRKRELEAQTEQLRLKSNKGERKSYDLKEQIALEMKNIALGKDKSKTLEVGRDLLNKSVDKLNKLAEQGRKNGNHGKKSKTPTIAELMEKRDDRMRGHDAKMTGNEIELVD